MDAYEDPARCLSLRSPSFFPLSSANDGSSLREVFRIERVFFKSTVRTTLNGSAYLFYLQVGMFYIFHAANNEKVTLAYLH